MILERRRRVVSGGEMAYVDEGEGPAVVLLHGFPTSAHLWRNLVPLLAPRARVIAPDLLGYGDSAKPEGVPLDLRAQARYVRELLGGLGVDRVAAVGHGVGGGVAQRLAAEGGVEALVLLDSPCLDAMPVEGLRVVGGAQAVDDAAAATRLVERAFDVGMGHRGRLAEEDLAEFARPWRSDPGALLRAARALAGEGPAGLEDGLRDRGIPAFVVWGEDDPFHPVALAERLGEALPGSTVALLPGCSHFVLEDAPETVAPMVAEFLRVRYLGAGVHAGGRPVDLGVSFERPTEPPGLPDA